jgi:transcriptional regulator with XRE-family HTH domain
MNNVNLLKIKELRKEKKLTQIEISKLMGIAQTTYANIEIGRTTASYQNIKKLAEIFSIDKDDLYLKSNDEMLDTSKSNYMEVKANIIISKLESQLEFLQRQFEKVLDENGRLSRTLENLTSSGGGRSVKLKATESERLMLCNVA